MATTVAIDGIYHPIIEDRQGIRQHIAALAKIKPVLHIMTWDPDHEETKTYMGQLIERAIGAKKVEAKPGSMTRNQTIHISFTATIRTHYREGGNLRWEVKPVA